MIDYYGMVRELAKSKKRPCRKKPINLGGKAVLRFAALLNTAEADYMMGSATNDLPAIAAALADIVIAAMGAAVEHGIPMDKVFGLRVADLLPKLKQVKRPVGYEPPSIKSVIEESIWSSSGS